MSELGSRLGGGDGGETPAGWLEAVNDSAAAAFIQDGMPAVGDAEGAHQAGMPYSQAVRIPRGFRFLSSEVESLRRGRRRHPAGATSEPREGI